MDETRLALVIQKDQPFTKQEKKSEATIEMVLMYSPIKLEQVSMTEEQFIREVSPCVPPIKAVRAFLDAGTRIGITDRARKLLINQEKSLVKSLINQKGD